MASCEELESLILDRVAGALPEPAAAALESHLTGCPRCRSWRASCEEAVGLVTLPALTEAERKAFAGLPSRARAEFRRRAAASPWGRPLVASALGAAVAAALLLMVLPRWGARPGPGRGAPAAAVTMEGEGQAEELIRWALADPLEDPAVADADGEGDLEEDLAEPAPELDLDWEQME